MDRESAELNRKLDEQIAKEKEEERIKKEQAMKEARKRYNQKSFLYKAFHKILSNSDMQRMSVDQIDKLYAGRTK